MTFFIYAFFIYMAFCMMQLGNFNPKKPVKFAVPRCRWKMETMDKTLQDTLNIILEKKPWRGPCSDYIIHFYI